MNIKNVNSSAIFVISILLGVTVNTQTASAADAQYSAPSAIKQGSELYGAFCSRCHGPQMVNPGTVTYDLRKFPHDEKDRFMNSVANGKRGMPPMRHVLSQEEINFIWDYVLSEVKL
jgi:mono/diheme cytochrome c family protein